MRVQYVSLASAITSAARFPSELLACSTTATALAKKLVRECRVLQSKPGNHDDRHRSPPREACFAQRSRGYPRERSTACGVRLAACGLRLAACGLRLAACGLRLAACGLRLAACGLRLAACGLRLAACGLRLAACGLRLAACGLRLAACGLRLAKVPGPRLLGIRALSVEASSGARGVAGDRPMQFAGSAL